MVGFGGPDEGFREGRCVDLVVVVDELLCLGDRVGEVGGRRELVGVPGQVDVEGGDGGFVGIFLQDGEVA